MAHNVISNGAAYFIRSDIEGFFNKIPRKKVQSQLSKIIPEKRFAHLLDEAVITELDNLVDLASDRDLFPIYDIGVAQGFCLSPFIGNMLLHRFDLQMNGRRIICLRYIDDFLILGPNQKTVLAAFRSAQQLLEEHNLRAYNPWQEEHKAKRGYTNKGFEFLGCEVSPTCIRPSQKSYRRMLRKVNDLIKDSVRLMINPAHPSFKERSYVATLEDLNNVLQGWGNQYSFCNDIQLTENLDIEIDKRIFEYSTQYIRKDTEFKAKKFRKDRRRLLGVHLLSDSKSKPIIY